MRIPFPERVSLNGAALFAASLFAIQQFEHTALYFSIGSVAFILLTTLAFNTAGGLKRIAGVYIFSYSMLCVIVGLCYKAYLGEAADSNLVDPKTTIAVFVGGMASLLVAALISRHVSRRCGLLQNILPLSRMRRASVGCMVFGATAPLMLSLLGESGALLQSAFGQLNNLIPLGVIIAVMYEIRSSRGTRSVNLFALLGAGYFFALGLLHYSKEGILTPLVCWLIPVCLLRFRLSAVQVAGGLLSAFLIFHYLVPYAEYGRSYRGSEHNIHENIADSTRLLTHPNETRKVSVETTSDDAAGYFNKPEGFWDRLQFISVDDGLINVTDQGRVFGLWPIRAMFLNAIPRVFWPNKPNLNIGNIYAHEVDSNFTDEDKTTGISYSPTAEAYHMAKWWGIFVVAPLIWILLFVVFDALIGDLRASPWGLLLMVQVAHVAPEGQLTGPIYLVTFGAEIYTFCALFATYIAPHFAVVVLGPDRRIGAVHSSLKRSWDSTIQPTLGRRFGRKAPLDATLKNT